MFRKVEADYYVIVDGDDTYSAEHVRQLLEPVLDESAEMSVAVRLEEYSEQSFRPFHIFGNNLVRRLVNWIFQRLCSFYLFVFHIKLVLSLSKLGYISRRCNFI